MSAPARSFSRQTRIFLLIVGLIASLYLLTFRARIQSGDTRLALDAMTSLSRYGDWLLDESASTAPPLNFRDWHTLPLATYDVEENLHIRLALPALQLAQTIPRLGNIHTVWLFNILVAALTVGLIYLMLRALEYSDGVSAAVALAAGFATNLWAYSQTFFREPLVAFFLILSLYLLQASRRRRRLVMLSGIVAGFGALYLAYATKSSAMAALPAILIFALPPIRWLDSASARRLSIAAFCCFTAALLSLMLIEPLSALLQSLLSIRETASHDLAYVLRMFLLSPGGSLFGASPPLILALAGMLILLRRGQHRLAWMAWLLLAGYALGHAMTTGDHWFGGLSFPPRFLTPVIPALALCAAPIAISALQKKRSWLMALCLALLAYGAWIQFSAVSLSLRHYGESLPAEAESLSEWAPGLTQPRYFRWFVLPSRWTDLGFDFIWTRANAPWWGISFGLFALTLSLLLWRNLRGQGGRRRDLALLVTPMLIPLLLINLRSVYFLDPATRSQNMALHATLEALAQNANSEDILLLPHDLYSEFMLNHLDAGLPRAIALPRAYAEAPSDKQAALIDSDNPKDWFPIYSPRAMHHLAGKRERLFLLANTNAYMPWSFRPTERYLALHYYPLRELNLTRDDNALRLLEYSTRYPAPDPVPFNFGEQASDLVFGDSIHLRAFTLPAGASYRPAETLELSLLWQTDAPLDYDYTVAWFLADPTTNQPIVQGQDSMPQAGFAPTSSWRPGIPVWDNRAIRIPESAAPGEYDIWLLLYRYASASGEIKRLPVTGEAVTGDGAIGLLPATIKLLPPADDRSAAG